MKEDEKGEKERKIIVLGLCCLSLSIFPKPSKVSKLGKTFLKL